MKYYLEEETKTITCEERKAFLEQIPYDSKGIDLKEIYYENYYIVILDKSKLKYSKDDLLIGILQTTVEIDKAIIKYIPQYHYFFNNENNYILWKIKYGI